MVQALRDSLAYYNTLATKRYGVYRKIAFAINLTKFIGEKEKDSHERLKQIKKKGLNLNLPLIYVNWICDTIFDPNTHLKVTKGTDTVKIGLLEFQQELLEIENVADAFVLRYRNELDAFITSATAEILT